MGAYIQRDDEPICKVDGVYKGFYHTTAVNLIKDISWEKLKSLMKLILANN